MSRDLPKLNLRQERFCEHVVSGESAAQAYLKAGYKVSSAVAETNGPRLLRNARVRERIAELRKPTTKKILSSRDHKRELAMRIMEDPTVKMQDRLRAMEIDAKLAGHFEPDRVELDAGRKTLLSIKERAAQVSSALAARYGVKDRE